MTATARPADLPRRLGVVSAFAVLFGIMVGSGIYRVPATVAGLVPSAAGFILIWVVGGAISITGALVFGELSAMLPATGGRYVYLRESFGPAIAFVYAWAYTILLRPASHAALALVFASYLAQLVPAARGHDNVLAAMLLALLTVVNYRSVRLSAGFINVSTMAKVLALGGIAVAILAVAPPVPIAPAAVVPSWSGFGLAIVAVMWTYSGWSSVTDVSGEVLAGERNVPVTLVIGVALVVLLFILVNLAFLHAMPLNEIAASKAIAADVAGKVFGDGGRRFIAVVVLVSTFSSLNGVSLTSPRLPFAVGQDVTRLRRLGIAHPVFATPYVAVVLMMVLSVIFVLNHTFEQMADLYILGSWPFYILCTIGLFRLRRTRPDLPRPFRVPWYPWIPIAFLTASAAMMINAAVVDPVHAALGAAFFLVGFPVYFLLR